MRDWFYGLEASARGLRWGKAHRKIVIDICHFLVDICHGTR